MNITNVKEKVDVLCGKTLAFKYNGARNQKEEFSARIVKTYPSVFLVQVQCDNKNMRSFTYNDVLIETLEIAGLKIK